MAAKTSQTEELLLGKERAGYLASTAARIVMLLGIMLGHYSTYHDSIEIAIVSSVGGPLLVIQALTLYMVYRWKFMNAVGYLGLVIDTAILAFLPYTWYTSVSGTNEVGMAYNLKTSLPHWAYCLIVLNTLSIRPIFPVMVAIIFAIIWEVLIQLAIADPTTQFTGDFVEGLMGPKVIVAFHRMPQGAAIIIGAMLGFVAHTYRRTIQQAVKLEVTTNQMGRYFSPNVSEKITHDAEDFLNKKGTNQQVAVLFTDLRNFTATSEQMQPEEVVDLLRLYHSAMVDIIFENQGTLDKFLGDGMMATFGTPDSGPEDASNALLAAVAMQKKLLEVNQELQLKGKSPLEQGIGIHFGNVVAGNIGTHNRLEYTVIGDTVNAAARIENACKSVHRSLLISEDLYNRLRPEIKEQLKFEKFGKVTVKGKSEQISLYSVE